MNGSRQTPAPLPSFSAFVSVVRILGLERTAFGSRAKAPVEVDRPAFDWNAGRRQASRILIDCHRLLVGAERYAHRFQRLALVGAAQVECVIAKDGLATLHARGFPFATVCENDGLRQIEIGRAS